jgi:hypothetical protein
MVYQCIKNASITGNVLRGSGYALAPYDSPEGKETEHKFIFPRVNSSFVFGFQGVGHHYRCDLYPCRHLIVLHLISDGVPIYLQHASLDLSTPFELRICWSKISIRLYKENSCFINILGEGFYGGRWGFAINGGELQMPDIATQSHPSPAFKWIVVGDGYSNNRWPNRHFFSWPELAFGNRGDYLNACVAAGNTRRVIEIVERIGQHWMNATVLIAAGADDFIEDTPDEETLERLAQIIRKCKAYRAASVLVCGIPPRAKNDDQVVARNKKIRELAETEADGFVDFHTMLLKEKHQLLVSGDYPGATAQQIIAKDVLNRLDIPGELNPVVAAERQVFFKGRLAHRVSRLSVWLARGLGRIPAPGVH